MDSYNFKLIRFYKAIQKIKVDPMICKTKNITLDSIRFQLFLDNSTAPFRWFLVFFYISLIGKLNPAF